MHIEALDGEADLARILECAFEDAGRHLLRVGVIEHDAGVVAAEFQRDPLQGCRRTRHHLLAGRGRAGEGDLADIRVLGHGVAEIVGVGDDVEHALRQDIRDQFGELQG